MTGPSAEVLDLFVVPGHAIPLPGGQGRNVVAGDLVLSPDPAPYDLPCQLVHTHLFGKS